MNVGDICWVNLVVRAGDHEQPCRRPAIVLQRAELSADLPSVLVVPLTTDPQALRLPGTVAVEPDSQNGLHASLVALVFQVTAVDRALMEPTAGRVSGGTLRLLLSELERLTGRGVPSEDAGTLPIPGRTPFPPLR